MPPTTGPQQQKDGVAACYKIPARQYPFRLFINRGSIINFSYTPNPRRSAIAYSGALNGNGAGGAISRAGGINLHADYRRHSGPPTGWAIITGPYDSYGSLSVHHVIHANAPVYRYYELGVGLDESWSTVDESMSATYISSLGCGKLAQIEAIAFSLFSAGEWSRLPRSLEDVLRVAMSTIVRQFEGYFELKEVHLYAFTEEEADTLVNIANDMGLENLLGLSNPEIMTLGDKKILYGNLGWARVCDDDGNFQWERSEQDGGGANERNSFSAFGGERAYVRRIDISGEGHGSRVCNVSLVDSNESVVGSVVKSSSGQPIATFGDILSAHKLNLSGKIKWFQDMCAKLCQGIHYRPEKLIDVSQDDKIFDQSVDAVMSFSQVDLGGAWSIRGSAGEIIPLTVWYELILSQEDLGLWQRDETDGTIRMHINFYSEMSCPKHLTYFQFWGRILGKAIFSGLCPDFRLTKQLYKMILGWPLVLNDLRELDERYYNFLKSLREMGGNVSNLGLYFTVSEDLLGLRTKVPLVPNGEGLVVTEDNLPEYVDACVKYHLYGRCKPQLNAFLNGFFELVPETLLVAFDFQELEVMMCGSYTGENNGEEELTCTDPPPDLVSSLPDEEEKGEKTSSSSSHDAHPALSASEPSPSVTSPLPPPVPSPMFHPVEATLVDDEETVYDAIQCDTPNADERNYRIKHGQCPQCGMQTHKVNRMLKKSVPLSNQHVLNGRCLACNPIQPGTFGPSASDDGERRQSLLRSQGHLMLNREKLQGKRKKAGLCPQCGEIQTHKKSIFGTMKPMTTPGKVYKGHCLKCKAITFDAMMQAQSRVGEPLNLPTPLEEQSITRLRDAPSSSPNIVLDVPTQLVSNHANNQNETSDQLPPAQRRDALPPPQQDALTDRLVSVQHDDDMSEITNPNQEENIGSQESDRYQSLLDRKMRENEEARAGNRQAEALPSDQAPLAHSDEERRVNTAGDSSRQRIGAIPSGGGQPDKSARAKESKEVVLKLSYGIDGWERIVLDDDVFGTMFQWTRPNADSFAYVRKVQCLRSNNCVTLLPPEEGLVDPIITCNGQAILDHTDILSAQKMEHDAKIQWFRKACDKIRVDQNECIQLHMRRSSLLTDSIESVMPLSRNDLQKRWKIDIVGQKRDTANDWFELVAAQVFNPSFGLFEDRSREMRLQINPSSEKNCAAQKNYDHLIYFRFIGRLLGKALFEGQQINWRFGKMFYKIILGWPITLDDLKSTDLVYYNFLESLNCMGAGVDHLALNFSVMGEASVSKSSNNGPDIEVNEKNLPDYIDACLKHHTFGQYEAQLSEIILGFYEIIPEPLLAIFDFQELENLLCGPYVDHSSVLAFDRSEIEQECKCLELLAEESLKALGEGKDSSAFETDPTLLSKYVSRILWPDSANDFVAGLRVDAKDRHCRWFVGSVIEVVETEGAMRLEGGGSIKEVKAKVHFDGYSSKYDESYTISDFHNGSVCPLYTNAPMPNPVQMVVHHRGMDLESKTSFLFGHPLCIQCHNEWSTARAGAHVLDQVSASLETWFFKYPSEGNKLSPVERIVAESEILQTRKVIASIVEELIVNETKYIAGIVENARKTNKSHDLQRQESLTKKMNEVLPLLPFEIRVTMAEYPLGTSRKEACLPFLFDRTIGNYMNSKNSLVLHWRKLRDLARDQAQREAEAEQLKSNGDMAFDECNLAEAIKLYTRAIELNPTNHQYLANRSAAYLRIGDTDGAMKDKMSILLIKPECPRGYYQKASALSFLDRYEDAVSVFEQGLIKYPGDSALSFGLESAKEACLSLGLKQTLTIPTSVDTSADSVQEPRVAAAICLQSNVRSWQCKRLLSRKKEQLAAECIAATKIQALARSIHCQRQLAQIKETDHRTKSEATTVAETEQSDEESTSLDALAVIARNAAKRLQLSIKFVPRPDGLVAPNAELLCNHPLNAISDLTLQTWWRKDDKSVATKTTLPQSISESPEEEEADDDIDNTRMRLSLMAGSMNDTEPIQLPKKYIEEIKTDSIIGRGYYGRVVLGLDMAIRQQFAIKMIDPLVIEQSLVGLCSGRLESIQKTFCNEVKVLTQLRHPNIASLYGYSVNNGLKDTCLLYELAVNGSLDNFFRDTLGRDRLSDARVRARIAFEVATVLRFMHEGLAGGAVCFHRDIKSANICLTADFHVRVVDVGLSKYVTEPHGSFSSAGPTGTPGYTCPEYLLGGTPFTSACDVFSFGIVLCDLITGKTSCQQAQHYLIYRKSKSKHRRTLEGDADECVDWGRGHCLKKMAKLASKCLRSSSSDRPKIGRVVRMLQQILNDIDACSQGDIDESISSESRLMSKSSDDFNVSLTSSGNSNLRCRICGETSSKCIQCSGSQRHTHCHNCVESVLIRNMNRFKYDGLTCLNDSCNSNPYPDKNVADLVSKNVWDAYSTQRKSGFSMEEVAGSASKCVWTSYSRTHDAALVPDMETRVLNLVEEKFQQMQTLQVKLSAGNGLPCPKLFYLVEADAPSWRHPKEWAKNTGSVKLYLYFVCSHSMERVSDNCRIKLRYSRDWLKAIAPAFNMSLNLLMLSLGVSIGREAPLEFMKIKDLDEWAKALLDDDEMSLFEEAKGCDENSERSLQTLVGNSLSCVAEKAASSNISWQSELVPVFDSVTKEPTFVKKRFASEPRYQVESEILSTP